MRYFYRAQARAQDCHKADELQWLIVQDEAERSSWVDRCRNSQMYLGEVIALHLVQREALWAIPQHVQQQYQQQQRAPPAQRQHSVKPRMKVKGGGSKGGGNEGGGKGSGPAKKMESKLRDGKLVCMAFNHGKCQANPCNKGRHMCAGVTLSDRVCGGAHPATSCSNPRVTKR